MSNNSSEIRTAELKKLVTKLEKFGKQLKDKIIFQQGQVELVDDIIKQLQVSINDINEEENAAALEKENAARRTKDRNKMKGVKTPKPDAGRK